MSFEKCRPDVTASTDRRYSTVVTEFKRRKGLSSSVLSVSGNIRPADVLTDTADTVGIHGKSYIRWDPVDERCPQNPKNLLMELDGASPDLGKPNFEKSDLETPDVEKSDLGMSELGELAVGKANLTSPESLGLSSPPLFIPHYPNSDPPNDTMDVEQGRSHCTTSTPMPIILVTHEGESPKASESELKEVKVPAEPEKVQSQQSTGSDSTLTRSKINHSSWSESSFPSTTLTGFDTDPYPVFSELPSSETKYFSKRKERSNSPNRTYTVPYRPESDPLFKKLEFEPSSVSPRTSYHTAVEMVTPLMYPPGDGSRRSYDLVSARNSFQGNPGNYSAPRLSHRPSIASYSIVNVEPIEPIDLGELGVKLKKQRKYRRIGWFLVVFGVLILVADAIFIIYIEANYPSSL